MAGQNYDYPTGQALVDESGQVTISWGQFFQRTHNNARTLQQSGTTANRPTANLWIGRQYWDTDLGAMYWVSAVSGGVATWITWSGGGGGGASWGSITGTLSAQTDLQTALNGKASVTSVTAVNAKTKYVKAFTWTGGGSAVVAAGSDRPKITINVPGTITGAMILTEGGVGSCQIDLWKDIYANYPPTIADSITAAALPTVTAGIKSYDTTLTGWTTAVSAGDVVSGVLNSSSTFTMVQLFLEITP